MILTCVLIVSVVAPYTAIICAACDDAKYHDLFDLLKYMNTVTSKLFRTTEIIFAFLFVLFTIVAAMMMITLKKSVP